MHFHTHTQPAHTHTLCVKYVQYIEDIKSFPVISTSLPVIIFTTSLLSHNYSISLPLMCAPFLYDTLSEARGAEREV